MTLRKHARKLASSPAANSAVAVLGLAACAWLLLSSSTDDEDDAGKLKEIPSPKGAIPYFGHLLILEEEVPVAQFNRWHEELGPIISIQMGVKQWLSISDPYLAYEIFNVNGRYTSDRPYTTYLSEFFSLNSKGITTGNPSQQWKKTRAAAIQILSPKNHEHFEKLHGPEVDALIESLLYATKKHGAVDVHSPLQLTSLNVILSTCFGKRVESTEDPLFKEITAVMTESMRRSSASEELNTFLPILTVVDVLFGKKKDMRKFIYEKRNPLFDKLIKEALKSGVTCFAKSLTELEDVNEYNNVLVTLSDAIFAGTDTTAVTLTWMMVILCHYPHVQQTIRDELDEFIYKHKRLPTFNEWEHLPYSASVQKECMRFRPTSPFGLPHVANQDFECSGYLIPKGATIVCNMHAMHRNKKFCRDPEKFIPDRFYSHAKPMYTSANAGVEDRDHFNFGWGRRTCPGAYLAEMEMFNVWVRLFSTCIIEPAIDASGKPVYPDLYTFLNGGIVTMPFNPTMRIIRRTDALI
ncbi:cytochrome P450 [Fennellomyces sp. T-0311]|nr:cytochrome P450 [Fennellomyces sp. T-0311]